MKKLLPFLLFLFLFGGSQRAVKAAPHAYTAYDLINGVNDVRASYGLPPLEVNNNLMAAAQAHSDYQASLGQATHTGEGGTTAADRARTAGYGGGADVSVTENIFSGAGATALIAINWWVGDTPHLQTLIGPYKHIGAGMAIKNGVTYFTLDVGYLSGDPGTGADATGTGSGTEIPLAVATPREDGSIVHIVGFGQTLWTIATLYGITVDELLTLNNLTESSVIFPGEELIIQLPTNGPTFTPSGPTYTPAPTTPTITPTPTTRPTRTPRPTRTLIPEDRSTSTPAPGSTAIPTSTPPPTPVPTQSSPLTQSTIRIAIIALVVFAAGLVLVGNVFDKKKGDK